MSNIVKGMEKFIEYFKEYSDNYIIVGGTAATLLKMEIMHHIYLKIINFIIIDL